MENWEEIFWTLLYFFKEDMLLLFVSLETESVWLDFEEGSHHEIAIGILRTRLILGGSCRAPRTQCVTGTTFLRGMRTKKKCSEYLRRHSFGLGGRFRTAVYFLLPEKGSPTSFEKPGSSSISCLDRKR